MRYAARADGNQKQIILELRQLGFSVFPTHRVGHGFPDLTIGRSGITLLVEVKRKGEKLTPDEVEFFETFSGAACVAYCTEDVIRHFERMTA